MKQFKANDHVYFVDERTAVAVSAGDSADDENARQYVIFIRDFHAGCHDDAVVFNGCMPDTEEEMEDLLCDEGFSTDCEDLATVLPVCDWIGVQD